LASRVRNGRSDCRLQFNPLQFALGVCLALLLLMAMSHATIGHPVAGDADHCTICLVAHSLVPLGLLVVAAVFLPLDTPVPELVEVRAAVRYWYPAFFTRPPPSCS
jgi:hypothetical protein